MRMTCMTNPIHAPIPTDFADFGSAVFQMSNKINPMTGKNRPNNIRTGEPLSFSARFDGTLF